MSITIIGYLLLPLGLVAFFLGSRLFLLGLATFFSAFSATAVINFTSSGLQPSYYFGLLFIVRVTLDTMLTRKSFTRRQWQLFGGFVLFAVIAFLSIIAIPFDAKALVVRPSGKTEVLKLTKENITQYLYVGYVLVFTGAVALSRLREKEIVRLSRIFIASGVFVSLWGWLQVVSFYSAVPYPDFLFNNNVSFSQNFEQLIRLIGIKRMTSVCPEPSMLAKFLLIPTFMSLYAVYNKGFLVPYKYAVPLAAFFVVTMVGTTSSTALAAVVGGFGIFIFVILYRKRVMTALGVREKPNIKGLMLFVLTFSILAVIVLVVAFVKIGLTLADLGNLIDILLFNKLDSQSGDVRISGGAGAIELLLSHPLLGVGWGSNRSFDFLSNIGATTGFIGLSIMIIAHLVLGYRMTILSKTLVRDGQLRLSHYPLMLLFIVVVKFFIKVLSDPSIAFLDYWILIGIMIACVRGLTPPRGEMSPAPGVSQKMEEES